MTIALILLLAAAVLVLATLAWLARGHRIAIRSLQDIEAHILSIDVDALLNLFDPRSDEYLKTRLTSRQYNSLRRERCRVGAEYVRRIAKNSAVLLTANSFARVHAADEASRVHAAQMVNLALRTRAAALNALVMLHVGSLFPALGDPSRLGILYKNVLGNTLSLFQQPKVLSA